MSIYLLKSLRSLLIALLALTAMYTIAVTAEKDSIERGRDVFHAKCGFCHNTYSTETIVGPGLKGILKKKKLPVSRRPATPENIIRQLKDPFDRMPSFEYLTEQEMNDIISFLKTL